MTRSIFYQFLYNYLLLKKVIKYDYMIPTREKINLPNNFKSILIILNLVEICYLV
jgi:hypothetical protein